MLISLALAVINSWLLIKYLRLIFATQVGKKRAHSTTQVTDLFDKESLSYKIRNDTINLNDIFTYRRVNIKFKNNFFYCRRLPGGRQPLERSRRKTLNLCRETSFELTCLMKYLLGT